MVKMIFVCRRRDGVDHARYARMVLEDHVPIALRHHPAMRAYTVNIVEQVPKGAAEIDSIAELTFDSLEDYRTRLYDSAQGERIVHADVARFLGGADAYAATEHVQKFAPRGVAPGVRSPGVKMFCPVRRRPGMTHEEFVDHWLNRHVPLALQHHPGLARYVTNVVDQRVSPAGEEWDGFGELHFARRDDFEKRFFGGAESERVIREDIPRFIGHSVGYIVAEHVQLACGEA
jgi:uncharacterized protein (TIGR02118 family)